MIEFEAEKLKFCQLNNMSKMYYGKWDDIFWTVKSFILYKKLIYQIFQNNSSNLKNILNFNTKIVINLYLIIIKNFEVDQIIKIINKKFNS